MEIARSLTAIAPAMPRRIQPIGFWQDVRMQDERSFTLRPVDQARADFAALFLGVNLGYANRETIEAERYPASPRIQALRRVLAKFGPMGPAPLPPARPRTPEERDPTRAPQQGRRRTR